MKRIPSFPFVMLKRRQYRPYPEKRAIDYDHPNDSDKIPSWRYWALFFASLTGVANLMFMTSSALSAVGIAFFLNVIIALATTFSVVPVFYKLFKALRRKPEERAQNLLRLGLMVTIAYVFAHLAFLTLIAVAPGANILLAGLYILTAGALGVHLVDFTTRVAFPYLASKAAQLWRFLRSKPSTPVRLHARDARRLTQQARHLESTLTQSQETWSHRLSTLQLSRNTVTGILRTLPTRLAHFYTAEKTNATSRGPFYYLRHGKRAVRADAGMNHLLSNRNFNVDEPGFKFFMDRSEQHFSKLTNDIATCLQLDRALANFNQLKNDASSSQATTVQAAHDLLHLIYKNPVTTEWNPTDGPTTNTTPFSLHFNIDRLDLAIREIQQKADQIATSNRSLNAPRREEEEKHVTNESNLNTVSTSINNEDETAPLLQQERKRKPTPEPDILPADPPAAPRADTAVHVAITDEHSMPNETEAQRVGLSEQDLVDALNTFLDFPLQDSLQAMLTQLVELAKAAIEKRYLKKLQKLHEREGFTIAEIRESLKSRLTALMTKNSDWYPQELANSDDALDPTLNQALKSLSDFLDNRDENARCPEHHHGQHSCT